VVDLVLLKRDKKIIIPDLADAEGVDTNSLPTVYPVYGETESASFCRFNVTYDINNILDKELEDLNHSLKQVESTEEAEFIKLAKEQVIQRRKEWNDWTRKFIPGGKPKAKPKVKRTATPVENPSSSQDDKPNNEKKPIESDSYWYYQSADNQMLFLHPLCSKMLIHEYGGDFTKFPHHLKQCKIIEIENVELEEDLRKRYPILRHVPCGCMISLVEIDMRNIVSKETYNLFTKDIKQRKYKRDDKVRKRIEEEREELRMEEFRKEEERLSRERLIQELHISNFPSMSDWTPPPTNDIHYPELASTPTTPQSSALSGVKKKPVKSDWKAMTAHKQEVSSSSTKSDKKLQGDWAKSSKPTQVQTSNSRAKDDFPSLSSSKKKK